MIIDIYGRGVDMRKDNQRWKYDKSKSAYDKSDYRSRLYEGKWENAWLKAAATYAVDRNVSIYEAMWRGYADKMEHMPSKLFKFFPFNHNSLKCLEANAVFMNNPRNFNDPFDCMLCANEDEFIKKCLIEHLIKTDAVNRGILTAEELNMLEVSRCENAGFDNVYSTFDRVVFHLCYDENIHKRRKGEQEIRSLIYRFMSEYRIKLKQLREHVAGITSFANIDEFELTSYMELWAHYAQNNEGFCVEYDLAHPLKDTHNNAMVLGGLLPCNYGTKQVVLSKQKIYKYVRGIPFTQYEKIEFDKSVMMSFMRKSSAWSYEKEWRLILPLDICEVYENMIPFYPIKSIYLGCRMASDNKEFIYRLAKRKGIAVFDMNLHEYKFEMDYSRIDIDNYFIDKNKCILNKLQKNGYKI